uniref:Cwf19-like C-terminal domain-containing protein n=1 Tax=Paramoeba aestuarina TaxID=180227 RepID=A0A7S4KHV3_9EUKA|mmetsp:Transcript_19572/g.30664  ORF Transcript_19572/g.30664 Transcript_19572/m.30664 type:complete len:185 (+) Transcript_19572:406-960(+)
MKLTHEDNTSNALPQNAPLVQGTTPCPFAHRSPNYQQQHQQESRKRRRENQPHEMRKKAPPSGPPPSCWFCLDSPQVEGHLITSVGSAAYLALPKGPLVPREEVLIVPIQHKASTALLEDEEKKEIRDYIDKLKECFAKKNKDIVVFERYQPSRNFPNPHMHLQITPIDKRQADKISPFFSTRN